MTEVHPTLDELVEPLDAVEVKRLLKTIVETGTTQFHTHALQRLSTRDMTTVDVANVLRAGVVQPAEYEAGSWRYRVQTKRMTVVVVFCSRSEIVVVTAWRNQRP